LGWTSFMRPDTTEKAPAESSERVTCAIFSASYLRQAEIATAPETMRPPNISNNIEDSGDAPDTTETGVMS
ncbi:MAG TPA: hypothetical protein VJ897_05295, partial [Salibaculum sp.]|nr:hypothetical protein [Salibaculum sp.]